MALTKVTGQVVNTSTDLTVGVLTATTASFTGNVSVGGTLTYEDVTNVDSVGLITARNGISVTGSNISVESSEDRLLYLKSTDANAYITFEDTDSSSGFANRVGTVSDGLYFSTGGGGERARIDSSGRIGIGMVPHTSSTGYALQIDGGASSFIQIFNDTSGNTVNDGFVIGNDANTAYLVNKENTPLVFRTNNTERVRIKSDGKVGIGTVNPLDELHVNSSSANVNLRLTRDLNNGARITGSDGASPAFIVETIASGTATERARIDSSGRFGIGTNSPATILDVQGSGPVAKIEATDDSNARVRILSANTRSSFLEFADTDDSDVGEIVYSHSNNNMRFVTAATERMRLDGGGRLLIGHDSSVGDDNNLQLVGTTADGSSATFWRSSDDNGNPQLNFVKTRGTVSSSTVVQDDDTLGRIRFYGWDGNDSDSRGAEIIAQVDGTPGTDDMPGRLIFATTSDGSRIPTERMRIDSSGRLLLGTTTHSSVAQTVYSTENSAILFQNSNTGTGSANGFYVGTSTGTDSFVWNYENGALVFATNNTERLRIDDSGRLLIGTNTSRSMGGHSGPLQVSGTNFSTATVSITNNANSSNGAYLFFSKQRSGSVGGNTILQSGDLVGQIRWLGADGTNLDTPLATIDGLVDGTPGENDMPGRIVFSTTADGAASPTERVRITSGGYFKASNNGTFVNSTGAIHEISQSATGLQGLYLKASSSVYANDMLFLSCNRASNANFYFMVCRNSNTANNAILLRGDGNAYADGSWNGGGADYAEYFEWSDGNASAQDRRGISVVLDGDKIREAVAGEEPIGVISGNPSVVGDGDVNQWKNKHLRDDYGSFILDENGDRQVNPDHNPDLEYIPRENRPEWDCVGLMGKLRIRKGQITGSRWIKMRDVSDTVEEWLVR